MSNDDSNPKDLFGVFLHRLSAGDYDRDLHDHPWAWAFAIILSGGYIEVTRHANGVKWTRDVKWFNWIPGYKFHTILRLHKAPTWTLFVHGPRVKQWGFARAFDSRGYRYETYNVKNFPNQVEGE